jgi:outer membrane protein assembly factor BamB
MSFGTGGRGYGGVAVVAVALVAAALLIGGCGSSSSGKSVNLGGAGYPNGNLANMRNASTPPIESSISSSNVNELDIAWTLPIEAESAFGSYASSPVFSGGVIYSQDLASNVQAIDADGNVLWTKKYELPDHGPNGVVAQAGLVVGATPTSAFALDQKTGKQVWSTPLIRNEKEGIDMAPGYIDGKIFVSTVPVNVGEFYGAGGVGTLWALDVYTGKKLWHFDTVPKNLWGKPKVNSGGGLWYTPAFDEDGNGMYFGVGNPAPFPGTEEEPWGSSRPGPNLYSDSMVKLNPKTGKMNWYYQLTPHALYDWDFQNPPILVGEGKQELAIGAGKSGYVVALNAQTGKPVWKRAVGKHNGHDDDGLLAMRGETSKLKLPATVYPGSLGGVIAPMSTDGKTVFVPVVNSPLEVVTQTERQEPGPLNGELVALDVKTGAIKWKHEFPNSPPYGFTTVSNDLVFATTSDGNIQAFETNTGRVAWQATLPTGTNAGVSIAGNMLIAPAGLAAEEGQTPQIVAYRLGG